MIKGHDPLRIMALLIVVAARDEVLVAANIFYSNDGHAIVTSQDVGFTIY